mgnify:CR=1 FL=1
MVTSPQELVADVVEKAYRRGAIFTSWMDHFSIDPWLESLAECGLTAEEFTGARELDAPLPWDHLNAGVSREFLLRERRRAFEGKISDDCRYAAASAGPAIRRRENPCFPARRGLKKARTATA